MKDQFITETFSIDLSASDTSFTEENPRFKDSIWTKYTLPISVYYDRDFLTNVGQYSSFTNENLPKYVDGIHIFEGKMMKGKLEFVEFYNHYAKIQIDSGFEELPNFDKKLEDLPLLEMEVEDIYAHAEEVCKKKYPDTNYNFPKLYTDAYSLDSDGFKYFDSFINNRRLIVERSVMEFPKNEIVETTNNNQIYWDCINRNIIHPLPYVLYILKTGFADAGFELKGEILTDETLINKCIYSGKDYHTTGEQKEHIIKVFAEENDRTFDKGGQQYASFIKSVKITAPGKYRVALDIFLKQGLGTICIKKNENQIAEYTNPTTNKEYFNNTDNVIDVTIEEAEKGVNIEVKIERLATNDIQQKRGYEGIFGIARIELRPIRQHKTDGSAVPFIINANRVNIKRAVPDITFGELVNIIKNWRNYDLTFENGVVTMDRIKIDKSIDPMDFREFEIENPMRKKNDKTAFHFKFPEVDDAKDASILIDEQGTHINPVAIPKNTTEISINGMVLPRFSFRATTTAKALKENNMLLLVEYKGTEINGTNNTIREDRLHGKAFADSVKDWYMNRLTNFSFKWSFICKKSSLRNFNIRSSIFCYQKKHWIKSWTKRTISPKLYSVEIETETFS